VTARALICAAVACLAIAAPARAETALEFAAAGMGRAIVEHAQPVRHGRHARQAVPLDIRSAPQIVAEAARYIGTRNPMHFRGPGCKAFINMVARRAGYLVNASMRAFDVAGMGWRVSRPHPGDYRVSARYGGGHVEIVASVDGGRVTTINGNKGRNRVGWSHRTVAGAAYYRPIRIASM